MSDTAWMVDGTCRATLVTHLFFSTDPVRQARAKILCRQCPVQEACLEYASEINAFGIWGGLDEEERRSRSRRLHINLGAHG